MCRHSAPPATGNGVFNRIEEIFAELELDDAVRAVIMTGAGQKAFVAGSDIKEIREAGQGRPALIKKGQEVLAGKENAVLSGEMIREHKALLKEI